MSGGSTQGLKRILFGERGQIQVFPREEIVDFRLETEYCSVYAQKGRRYRQAYQHRTSEDILDLS